MEELTEQRKAELERELRPAREKLDREQREKAAREVKRPPPESRAGRRLAKQETEPEGIRTIRDIMAAQKKKGNPRDFVVLSNHDRLYDGERTFGVAAYLPAKLEPGNHVYIYNSKGALRPVQVKVDLRHGPGDTKQELLVTDGNAEWNVPAAECYPTPIPRAPTAVHRRELHNYIGDAMAARWWSRKAGMRLHPPR